MIKKSIRKLEKGIDLYLRPYLNPRSRVQPHDMIFASFQKSGRTWVRFFMANYVVSYYRLGVKINWENFINYSPGYLCNHRTGLLNYPFNIPRVVFSHDKYIGNYFPNRKVVLMTRNVCDIVISFYYFHKNRNKIFLSKDINEFALNEFDYDYFFGKLNFFARKFRESSEYLIIRYEDMLNDSETSFRNLIEFSPHEFDEEIFQLALKNSSFEKMRQMEMEQNGYSGDKLHTRKAKSGQGKENLSEQAVFLIEEKVKMRLDKDLREYYLDSK